MFFLKSSRSDTMDSDVKDIEPNADDANASDWENRRLCSDGNCIGVIGPDGRCKECGKPFAGGPASVVSPPPEPTAASINAVAPPVADEPAGAGDGWENRRLCSDESCIGVIGPDGRCRECGKPFAG
jgi:hypothetical protein